MSQPQTIEATIERIRADWNRTRSTAWQTLSITEAATRNLQSAKPSRLEETLGSDTHAFCAAFAILCVSLSFFLQIRVAALAEFSCSTWKKSYALRNSIHSCSPTREPWRNVWNAIYLHKNTAKWSRKLWTSTSCLTQLLDVRDVFTILFLERSMPSLVSQKKISRQGSQQWTNQTSASDSIQFTNSQFQKGSRWKFIDSGVVDAFTTLFRKK